MELGIKDIIEGIALVSGWVAAFTAVRVKTNHLIEALERSNNEHRDAIQRTEDLLRKENRALHDRIDDKKQQFDNFQNEVKKDMERLWKMSNRFIEAAEAEKRFVLKTELKLMMEKLEVQYKHLDEKLEMLLASTGAKQK